MTYKRKSRYEIMKSQKRFYIGIHDEDGPYDRISEYFDTEEKDREVWNSGNYHVYNCLDLYMVSR